MPTELVRIYLEPFAVPIIIRLVGLQKHKVVESAPLHDLHHDSWGTYFRYHRPYIVDTQGQKFALWEGEPHKSQLLFDLPATIELYQRNSATCHPLPLYASLPLPIGKLPAKARFWAFKKQLLAQDKADRNARASYIQSDIRSFESRIAPSYANSLSGKKNQTAADFLQPSYDFASSYNYRRPELDRLTDLLHGKHPPSSCQVYLTHDVDDHLGAQKIAEMAAVEERHGLTSTWFVTAENQEHDPRLYTQLLCHGHSLGLHGFYHDHGLAEYPIDRLRELFTKAQPLTSRYKMAAFRAPALHTSANLLQVVAENFLVDSSIPAHRIDFTEGSLTYRPYMIGELQELPLTLPLDDTLRAMDLSWPELFTFYKKRIKRIMQWGGTVVLTTHCQPHLAASTRALEAYDSFLAWLKNKEHLQIKVIKKPLQ